MIHIEGVWNDDRTFGTRLHGEFHLRLEIDQVSENRYFAEEALETSGRALLVGPEFAVGDLPTFERQQEFPSFSGAYEWISSCESIGFGHLRELLQQEYDRHNSGAVRDLGALTPWSGRTTVDLFDVELSSDSSDAVQAKLQELRKLPPSPLPRSINDLQFHFRDHKELLPQLEKRFIQILSGS